MILKILTAAGLVLAAASAGATTISPGARLAANCACMADYASLIRPTCFRGQFPWPVSVAGFRSRFP